MVNWFWAEASIKDICSSSHGCEYNFFADFCEQTEYEVPECNRESNSACIDRRHAIAALPIGGDLIQAVLHQHAGGMGGVIYDKVSF